MNRLFQVAAGAILVVGSLASGCVSIQMKTASGAPLARQISQSTHCGLTAPGHLLVDKQHQLGRLEALTERSLPLGPIRAIDFSQEHVVFVTLGQKPTGGFSVTLASSQVVDQQLVLTVHITEPEPGSMVTQALTTPCAVIAVTATGWNTIRIVPAERKR
jgi:hypothetical protein